jgi:SAM-dependent methyltransferase
VAVRALARGLNALNARTPWSHNDHFHGWVLRRLRAARGPAVVVDVGCGAGALVAALRARGVGPVVGVDPDAVMAASATRRCANDGAVTVARTSFFDLARGDGLVPAAGAGGITMIASLHHLAHERGLTASLAHARGLLAPGGRLLVVGLARPSGPADYAVDAVSVLANPVMGLVKTFGRRLAGGTAAPPVPATFPVPATSPAPATLVASTAGGDVLPAERADVAREGGMPVRDPDEAFADVVDAAAAVLPGARVRRRLWFRYSLEWTRP